MFKVKNPKPDSSRPHQEGESFFDDCPICQTMKFANRQGRNPIETELLQAFREAKKSGAAVGGKWFENPSLASGPPTKLPPQATKFQTASVNLTT